MAFDEKVADRIRKSLQQAGAQAVTEKKMFGGIAFLIRRQMVIGVLKDELMLRLGNAGAAAALKKPHMRPMDFTGKILKSMLFVKPAGYKTPVALKKWVSAAVKFAQLQPVKKPQSKLKASRRI